MGILGQMRISRQGDPIKENIKKGKASRRKQTRTRKTPVKKKEDKGREETKKSHSGYGFKKVGGWRAHLTKN